MTKLDPKTHKLLERCTLALPVLATMLESVGIESESIARELLEDVKELLDA